MLALAGYPLGLRFRFLDPAAEAPAEQLAERVAGAYEDLESLQQFAAGLDLVTYEFENVPVSTAHFLEQRLPVLPPPAALEAAQDRVAEKTFFQKAGLATVPFEAVDGRDDLAGAVERIGLPAVLKTRRYGYDGKGQVVLHRPDDVTRAWEKLGGVPLILEEFVAFEREVSLLAVRSRSGETAFYPLIENHHRDGMLRLSLAPAPRSSAFPACTCTCTASRRVQAASSAISPCAALMPTPCTSDWNECAAWSRCDRWVSRRRRPTPHSGRSRRGGRRSGPSPVGQ